MDSCHLDLDIRDMLTLALEEYTGAVVLVPHDRSLIRAVADELWLVAEGSARLFDGDLEDYKIWIEARRPRETVQAPPEKPKQEIVARKHCCPNRPNSKRN